MVPLADEHCLFREVGWLVLVTSLSRGDGFLVFDAELFLDESFQPFQGSVRLEWSRVVLGLDWFFDQDHSVLLFVLPLQVQLLSQSVEEIRGFLATQLVQCPVDHDDVVFVFWPDVFERALVDDRGFLEILVERVCLSLIELLAAVDQ